MLETILLLVVTALAFGLFFLVFLLKDTSSEQPARFHNCGSCNCQKSERRADAIDLNKSSGKEKPCHSDPARIS